MYFDLLEKKILQWNCFLHPKRSHFCVATSTFSEIVCRPDWFTISYSQSRIKFTICTPVKFPVRNFIPDRRSLPNDNKKQQLVYLPFSQDSKFNNIRASSPLNAAVIVCFVFYISTTIYFRLHTWVLFAIFFFCVEVKSNQIHGSLRVLSMKCLPPRIVTSHVILDSSNLTILRNTNLE